MALALGATVEELNVRLSSSALTRWMAFYELDPWGSFRDNLHAAKLGVMYANAHAKKGTSFTIDDFMYKDPDQAQEENQLQITQGFLALAAEATQTHD